MCTGVAGAVVCLLGRAGMSKNTNACMDGTVMKHHVACHFSTLMGMGTLQVASPQCTQTDGFPLASDYVGWGAILGESATLAGKMSSIPRLFSFAFAACLQNVPGAPLVTQTDKLGIASVHLIGVCRWSLPKLPQCGAWDKHPIAAADTGASRLAQRFCNYRAGIWFFFTRAARSTTPAQPIAVTECGQLSTFLPMLCNHVLCFNKDPRCLCVNHPTFTPVITDFTITAMLVFQ